MHLLGLAATAATYLLLPGATADPLPFERIQLHERDIASLGKASSLLSFGDAPVADPATSHRRAPPTGCKVFPGDKKWPADKAWSNFNNTLNGALIKTVPLAAPCYAGPNYDANRCSYVTANWANSSLHEMDPASVMTGLYQGHTCQIPSNPDDTCTLGGLPSYVVNATTVKQVQLAVNFARNADIRLIVRNTGHDFSGKSGGAGSLSIWTHNLNAIEYVPRFEDQKQGYSGPAFRGGSGVIGRDLFKAAGDKGLLVIGGEGQDVGILGGYLQNGGHSPMSSVYGLAADQVLSISLVTADGRFLTASSTENTDLFWALRGGGASTWGVVTSVTVRAHPSMPISTAQFIFTAKSSAAFWLGVRSYWERFIPYADAGTYSYFMIIPGAPAPTFIMLGFWAPNMTTTETTALLTPWLDDLSALDISVKPAYATYPTTYPALIATWPQEAVQDNAIIGSRLFPRSAWEAPNSETFNKTWEAWSTTNNLLISFNIRAPNALGVDNAVLPAWRETVLHTMQGSGFAPNADDATKRAVRQALTVSMANWKAATPGAGAYIGESDAEEVGWQESFFGKNYDRLLKIKNKYDRDGVFWAKQAVGSECMAVQSNGPIPDENGKLCRVK
ncbi:FAD-binding protein [Venustampulla echinocandica]|uniref:FAD-binding protein n=1 Tax=Venustampulla echinocandica TaxID=2656787 RepID=A0A370TLH2_9HELO|nr:FAD-binding protein [Venustampulla echinocandica]RDL36373.1 FAD-binding protein [Venustampulla echinocandica]